MRIGDRLVKERRAAWERWYGPVAAARWGSALWHTLGWAIFGAAYVSAVVFVSSGLHATPGQVLLVLAVVMHRLRAPAPATATRTMGSLPISEPRRLRRL